MASTNQASEILNRANPDSDPYFLLPRLKNEAGLTDEQSRFMLRTYGFAIPDGVIDGRVDCLAQRPCRSGFAA